MKIVLGIWIPAIALVAIAGITGNLVIAKIALLFLILGLILLTITRLRNKV